MIVQPLDWYNYGENVYLFTTGGDIFIFEKFQCYYIRSDKVKNKQALRSNIDSDCYWLGDPGYNLYSWNIDRSNKILSLLKIAGISPYSSFLIKDYLEGDIMNTSVHGIYKTENPSILRDEGISMYFDIETYDSTGNFTSPHLETSDIKKITVMFSSGEDTLTFILGTIPVESDDLSSLNIKFNFEYLETEKDLLIRFYELWEEYSPVNIYHYNGYDFDIPFLVERTIQYGLSINLGALDYGTDRLATRQIKIYSRIGIPKKRKFWLLPGIKNIDLMIFFQKFYPEFPSYKLDYVAKYFLGEGKTGLSIEEMFEIFENKDSKRMGVVLEYAYYDVLRLYQLVKKLNIFDRLIETANTLHVTVDQLLMMSDIKLTRAAIYNIDHAVLCHKYTYEKNDRMHNPKPGIYHSLKFYDLTGRFVIDPSWYKNNSFGEVRDYEVFVPALNERILSLPRKSVVNFMFSNFSSSAIRYEFWRYLLSPRPLGITSDGLIYTVETLDFPPLFTEPLRIQVRDNNYTIHDGKDFLLFDKGEKFPHLKRYQLKHYKHILEGKYYLFDPTIFEKDIPNLELSIRAKPSVTYRDLKSVYYLAAKLAEENGKTIRSWITVKYYNTVYGMRLEPYNLDLDWYFKKMRDFQDSMIDVYENIH